MKLGRHYDIEMVDLVQFDSEGKIVQMKEYLDAVAIHNLVEEHEKKTKGGVQGSQDADSKREEAEKKT